MMKRLFTVVIICFIAGCATVPPVVHDVRSTKTFDASYARVVDAVIGFFNNEKIPVKKGARDSGIVETEEIKVPYEGFRYLSDYCDCGTLGGLYVYHDVLGKFDVFIKETDDKKTSIHIGPAYRASLWWDTEFIGWVVCQSKGHLENKLIEHVNTALEDPALGKSKK